MIHWVNWSELWCRKTKPPGSTLPFGMAKAILEGVWQAATTSTSSKPANFSRRSTWFCWNNDKSSRDFQSSGKFTTDLILWPTLPESNVKLLEQQWAASRWSFRVVVESPVFAKCRGLIFPLKHDNILSIYPSSILDFFWQFWINSFSLPIIHSI